MKLKISENGHTEFIHETGTVYLCIEYCGAGIVSHELMHAVLWAYKHKKNKEQYPIIINNMEDEEIILYNLTYAINQFYRWYWKIVKIIKCLKKYS